MHTVRARCESTSLIGILGTLLDLIWLGPYFIKLNQISSKIRFKYYMQYLVCMPPGPRHGASMTWCVRELVLLLVIYEPGVTYERNKEGERWN